MNWKVEILNKINNSKLTPSEKKELISAMQSIKLGWKNDVQVGSEGNYNLSGSGDNYKIEGTYDFMKLFKHMNSWVYNSIDKTTVESHKILKHIKSAMDIYSTALILVDESKYSELKLISDKVFGKKSMLASMSFRTEHSKVNMYLLAFSKSNAERWRLFNGTLYSLKEVSLGSKYVKEEKEGDYYNYTTDVVRRSHGKYDKSLHRNLTIEEMREMKHHRLTEIEKLIEEEKLFLWPRKKGGHDIAKRSALFELNGSWYRLVTAPSIKDLDEKGAVLSEGEINGDLNNYFRVLLNQAAEKIAFVNFKNPQIGSTNFSEYFGEVVVTRGSGKIIENIRVLKHLKQKGIVVTMKEVENA